MARYRHSSVRVWLLGLLCLALAQSAAAGAPNVLFIAVDDLRPQLGCYGKSFMHSLHIDALAQQGVLFERAYCMVPTCGASRAALMTSIRPAPSRFVTHLAWADKEVPHAITLNTHFHNHGYTTLSLGKVFHHPTDSAEGWSEKAWRPDGGGYQNQAAVKAAIQADEQKFPHKKERSGPPMEAADAPDGDYADGKIAAKAIESLQRLAAKPDQPFFLAVGFLKPHLPFTAPQKYWDLYDRSQVQLPAHYAAPIDAPESAVHNFGELRKYAGIPPKGLVDPEFAREMIHGYYACVSFTDAQIGRVIAELDQLGLRDNTIIVLWGDHGWQLGEHGAWCKHSCFETSLHAPLLVVPPASMGIAAGTRVRGLTEFIDIYPSLCELAQLPIPAHVQGESFVPRMRDPSLPGKPFAVSRFGDGDSIRSEDFRFSEYTNKQGNAVLGRMLYDHNSDPGENVNISEQPAHADTNNELSRELNARKGRDES